jgi:hypothetical protein
MKLAREPTADRAVVAVTAAVAIAVAVATAVAAVAAAVMVEAVVAGATKIAIDAPVATTANRVGSQRKLLTGVFGFSKPGKKAKSNGA